MLRCKYRPLLGHETLHVSGAAVPDLPVMYSGGVLHIQSDSLSAEALFQLSQRTALLTAICLRDRTNGSKTTAQTETRGLLKHLLHRVTSLVAYFILCCEEMDLFHLAGCFQKHLAEPQEVVQLKRRNGVSLVLFDVGRGCRGHCINKKVSHLNASSIFLSETKNCIIYEDNLNTGSLEHRMLGGYSAGCNMQTHH